MIADLAFERADARGLRAARFVPRSSIPLDAACLVANGIRETLRELFGECDVMLGEPAAIDAEAWHGLTRDAHCFLTRGRQTDIVLTLPAADARALVMRAFGEGEPIGEGACSALELHAIERIAARCAGAFDPLCAERQGPSRPVHARELPTCVAFCDVRVHVPISITLGIGIVRDLPDPGPSGTLAPAALAGVGVDVWAEVATGTIEARRLLALRVGDVVRMDTKVGSGASLNVGPQRIARGVCGVLASHHAFQVHETSTLGVRP
ncbi:MAG: hypothetical protein NVS2B17_22380 [Candidatus Velthaea sp.]